MSDFFHVREIPEALAAIAFDPPAWTRLEPQSVTGDPTPGLEARIHDPLWMLLRQWQFGEFAGEDAGTPLGVVLEVSSERVTAWQPGDPADGAAARLLDDDLLDPLVEREPGIPEGPGLRERAEAGTVLVRMIFDAGFDARAGLLSACAFASSVPRMFRVIARLAPDAERAAAMLEAGSPPWLAGAPAAAIGAAADWLGWYRRNVSPKVTSSDSWIPERLEYRFSVGLGSGAAKRVLAAPLHEGGAIDWYSFDHVPNRRLDVDGEGDGVRPEPELRTARAMASPVRFSGMPADRFWQFEDGSVNLGKIDVQRHDLARLCFVEYALIHGNDWFVVPLDVECGSLTRVTRLTYTNTFGDEIVVPGVDDRGRAGRFRLFEIGVADSDATLDGLLVPPAARGTVEGRALEEVQLLRDETANLAWAVESLVQDSSGDPRARRDEEQPPRDVAGPTPPAELRYLLANTVPRHWIPLVPVPTTGKGGFILRKGTMTDTDESRGRLLDPTPFNLHEEEVPREGVVVQRVPSLTRVADGAYVRWIARRVRVGHGEGSSGLAFDSALPRR